MNERPRKASQRVYNQMRVSLAVLSPGFILAGTLGILGFAELRSSGKIVHDPIERSLAGLIFIVLGVLMGALRLTVLRRRRD
jgi:hypothetical protein